MKQFTLTFGNVGYGEAMRIAIPDPSHARGVFTVLFDGGGDDPTEFLDSAAGRAPFLCHLRTMGVEQVDAVIVSHIHEDHVSGLLPTVKAFLPKTVYQSLSPDFWRRMRPLSEKAGETVSLQKFTKSLNDFRSICEITTQSGGTVRQVTRGDVLRFPSGLTAEVLSPSVERANELEAALSDLYASAVGDVSDQHRLRALDGAMNNYSVVLRLDFGQTRVLLPGDTNRLGFEDIDREALKADLYKVGHHGQIDGADEPLLAAIAPKAVVCCASGDRRYNSAHPDLLRLIASHGAALYYSDCPPNPVGDPVPPHGLLQLTVDDAHGIQAEYR